MGNNKISSKVPATNSNTSEKSQANEENASLAKRCLKYAKWCLTKVPQLLKAFIRKIWLGVWLGVKCLFSKPNGANQEGKQFNK